ncbi:unnamed protein product [Meloidogyne enterolobii]|uniref:Uncharacterized protein n=1 Tax=Meloidogyne enterolobii TaxID=390850 RepID=A0ACB0YEM9_MELEN
MKSLKNLEKSLNYHQYVSNDSWLHSFRARAYVSNSLSSFSSSFNSIFTSKVSLLSSRIKVLKGLVDDSSMISNNSRG